MSILSEMKSLLAHAARTPRLDREVTRDWRFRAGYALGFTHALEDAIEIIEEESDETG